MLALEKKDLQALRKADTLVFHHDRPENNKNGTAGRIRCIKRTSQAELERDPYAPEDREYEMELDSWVDICSDAIPESMTISEFRDKIRASEVLYPYPSYVGGNTLSTVIGLLKAGDILKLRWYYGDGNDYMKRANLHRDHLELKIERPGKSKTKLMTFLLRVSVCEDNTARMLSSWY